jgi:hypothetical protein
MQPAGLSVHWLVNRDIVTLVIGVMLPYAAAPAPAGQTYQLHAVADFEDMLNEIADRTGGGMGFDMAVARFRVVVTDPRQFQQFVDYLSTTGSLATTARMLHAASGQGPFFDEQSQAPPLNVGKLARFLCAINLQRIADVAKSAGVYSLGLDVAPIAPASFFEAQVEYCLHLRLRVFVAGGVASFHVLSVPLNKRRRSDADGSNGVFEIAQNALNAVVPRWQQVVLALVTGSDGFTAHEPSDPRLALRNAVASRFESAAAPGFLRVCCAPRQLDAVMQRFFVSVLGGAADYSTLTALVACVSRQRVLLTMMQTSAPALGDSRWRSIAAVAMWFRRHVVSVREHLAREQAACAPPDSWWVRTVLAARVGQEAMPILDELAGLTTATSHPRDAVLKLRMFLADWFKVSGPLEVDDPAVAAATAGDGNGNAATSKDGKYSVSTSDVLAALEDLGSSVTDTLRTAVNADDSSHFVVRATVKEVAASVVDLVSGLASITLDVDDVGSLGSELPAVLPHELVRMRGRQFAAVVRPQTERLRLAGWTTQQIDWIEQDFQDLSGAYYRESPLKLALDACSNKSSFRDAWGCVQGRFAHLQRFCGMLATAYPVAVSAEDCTDANASAMGCDWLAPPSRIAALPGDLEAGVSDLSVQAALQARQFRRLQAVEM